MTRNIAAPLPFRFTSELLPDTSYLLTLDYEYFIFSFFFFSPPRYRRVHAFEHPTYPRRRVPSVHSLRTIRGREWSYCCLSALLQIESSFTLLSESILREKRF